jgi:CRP/FNR family transcriptional regulator
LIDLATIRAQSRFSALEEQDLAWVANRISQRTFASGAVLYREGAVPLALGLIESGYVKICRTASGSKPVLLQVFGPGEALGEIAIAKQVRLPVTALALTQARILELDAQDYHELGRRSARFLAQSLASLADLTQSYMNRIASFRGLATESRLGRFIAELCERLGQEKDRTVLLPLSLSRADMASAIDARTETVIRIMSRWEKEKLIYPTTRGMVISKSFLESIQRSP